MGLGRFGLLSRVSKLFFFCKLIWQLILEKGDDCLGKTFPLILAKTKIGFTKIFFVVKICDAHDADVMMQKQKQTKI